MRLLEREERRQVRRRVPGDALADHAQRLHARRGLQRLREWRPLRPIALALRLPGRQRGTRGAADAHAALGAGLGVAACVALRRGGALVLVARERLGRVEDRAVARAPAEVAVEGCLDVLQRGLRIPAQRAVERHDDARRAEAALRAVALRDALLDLVRLLRCADALDGRHRAAVDAAHGRQARVHGSVDHGLLLAVPVRDRHRAGAAATLAAAQLGAGEPQPVPQHG
mmetsp:Transcript_84207/g.216801  ORF Transcript_84207/g.216801 Transcript_84207/m.216801 type:complete len:228 (-) Transcript_84207:203-886(-)